jgi:hypothetical protein
MAKERVQRRLAAILAADVVGYGRLMEQDEAGTLAALKARRTPGLGDAQSFCQVVDDLALSCSGLRRRHQQG